MELPDNVIELARKLANEEGLTIEALFANLVHKAHSERHQVWIPKEQRFDFVRCGRDKCFVERERPKEWRD